MTYVGIDPGVSGGIAVLTQRGDEVFVRVTPMPDAPRELWEFIDDLPYFSGPADTRTREGCVAMVEFVRASPQMGVVSAFTFGRGLGGLHMALTAAGIEFAEILPQKWQPAMRVVYPRAPKGPDGKRAFIAKDKNISKARAQELFPGLTVTHAIADALLIAEYCRRVRQHGEENERAAHQGQVKEAHHGRASRNGRHGLSAD